MQRDIGHPSSFPKWYYIFYDLEDRDWGSKFKSRECFSKTISILVNLVLSVTQNDKDDSWNTSFQYWGEKTCTHLRVNECDKKKNTFLGIRR